jgi:hypothetical protein
MPTMVPKIVSRKAAREELLAKSPEALTTSANRGRLEDYEFALAHMLRKPQAPASRMQRVVHRREDLFLIQKGPRDLQVRVVLHVC